MKITSTFIPDVKLIEPKIFEDSRGYFFESYNEAVFHKEIGKINFVQDNESRSTRGTLRGLHYQLAPFAQSKLVRVVEGCVLDVAVDIRTGSPTFGMSVSVELSDENKKQFFIPRGFAHGFLVLSETAIFTYKVDNFYSKESDRGILFNDPVIGINWNFSDEILLSEKDKKQPSLNDADLFNYSEKLYE